MTEKLEVKRGEKIDDQAAAKSSGDFAVLVSQAPDGDVEGQYFYSGMTQCPYCGNVGFTRVLSTDVYMSIICGRCGMAFRA